MIKSRRNFVMTFFPDKFEQKDKVQGRVITVVTIIARVN